MSFREPLSLFNDSDFNFKERFGCIPKSIMKFGKDKVLQELISCDDSRLQSLEGNAHARGGGYAKNIGFSRYNPAQAKFIIDYYTKKGDTILDPFMGREVRPLIATWLNRKYIGFDTCSLTVEHNSTVLATKLPNHKATLIHGDGTILRGIEHETIDAVFTCPPYYNKERYSGETGDISHLAIIDFEKRIDKLFKRIYEVIKYSNYANKMFHPVIFTVGTLRKGSLGLLDMDYIFQDIALSNGFVLHDKLFTENNAPGAGFTFKRNYEYKFVNKNYETTLVFMKYK